MVIILYMIEMAAPSPALGRKGQDRGMPLRKGPGTPRPPDGPGGSAPAVRIEDRILPGVDVDGPSRRVAGEAPCPRDEAVIEGRGVVCGHGGLIGPGVPDDGDGLRDGKLQGPKEIKNLSELRCHVPVNDDLTGMQTVIEADIPDIEKGKGLDDLPGRPGSGNGFIKVHGAVHNHDIVHLSSFSRVFHRLLSVLPPLCQRSVKTAPFYRDFPD